MLHQIDLLMNNIVKRIVTWINIYNCNKINKLQLFNRFNLRDPSCVVMQMLVEMNQHDSGLLSIKNCFIACHDQAEGGNTIANTVTVISNLLISKRILQNTP